MASQSAETINSLSNLIIIAFHGLKFHFLQRQDMDESQTIGKLSVKGSQFQKRRPLKWLAGKNESKNQATQNANRQIVF